MTDSSAQQAAYLALAPHLSDDEPPWSIFVMVKAVLEAVEPIIRADEERQVVLDHESGIAYRDIIEAEVRERIAAEIEERCAKGSHRERVPSPREWPVCAQCMPYLHIVLLEDGEKDD
jgi:hypothetical protein